MDCCGTGKFVCMVLAALLLAACGEGRRPVPRSEVASAAETRCAQRAAESGDEVAGIVARMLATEDPIEAEAIASELGVVFERNPCAVLAQAELADLTEYYTAGFIGLLPASDAGLPCKARVARMERRRNLLVGEAVTGARATGIAVHVDEWIDRELAACARKAMAVPAKG